MIVNLADLPRSTEFHPPRPGIVAGERPKPAPPPAKPVEEKRRPLPDSRELAGRVPDLPVNPDLPPEKEFPLPRPAAPSPPAVRSSEESKTARAEKPAQPAEEPAPSPPEEPAGASSKTLRDLTPSLGKMVMAKANPTAARGEEASTGRAVGTEGKSVPKGAISEERGGGAYFTALNAPEIQYISYFASIKRKIELVWQYPTDAVTAGLQGDLTIDFVIGRNGNLESLELLRGSGYKILDDEAIGSIRKAAPYNPIPEQYRIPNLRIRAHFIYEMHTLKLR